MHSFKSSDNEDEDSNVSNDEKDDSDTVHLILHSWIWVLRKFFKKLKKKS